MRLPIAILVGACAFTSTHARDGGRDELVSDSYRSSGPVYRYANSTRRATAHVVSYRGRPVSIPELILDDTEPVVIDVPDLGQITVQREKYAVLFPLLLSNNEADHERAFAQLREQAQRDPGSLRRASEVRGRFGPWIEPTRNEPGSFIKDGFGNPPRYND